MAPTSIEGFLEKRQYYGGCYGYGCGNNSGWSVWGRWVALGVIIACVVLIAFLFSCFNSRRRRRRGLAPMYGTGWMTGKPPVGQQSSGYYTHEPYNGGAAPPYSPPIGNQATGNTFNSNEGYYGNHGGYGYGGQQGGIELQQPTSSYQPQRGGDPVYEAPQGPPPRKGDGIIR